MLIENLVIYTRKPYEDSEGRMIHHGYMIPKESDHYSAQAWSGWWDNGSSATMIDFAELGKTFPTFKDVTIKSLHTRGSGGRAYQVTFPIEENENFYVLCDLREDALMDTIFTQGIEKGGKLNGEFAFVRKGSQTNLVLVGSKDYEEAKAVTQKKKEARKISNKELKVGHKYSTHNGTEAVYLGSYYQIESYKFGDSTKINDTPKTTHVFVKNMDSKFGKYFEFKKTQHFTIESEQPVLSEAEAKEFFIEHHINANKKFFELAIKDIENCYMKWYERYLMDKKMGHGYKWHSENNLKQEIRKLKENAYEYYRQSIISDDKKSVVMDKEYVHSRINEAIKLGEQSIAKYDFFKTTT